MRGAENCFSDVRLCHPRVRASHKQPALRSDLSNGAGKLVSTGDYASVPLSHSVRADEQRSTIHPTEPFRGQSSTVLRKRQAYLVDLRGCILIRALRGCKEEANDVQCASGERNGPGAGKPVRIFDLHSREAESPKLFSAMDSVPYICKW